MVSFQLENAFMTVVCADKLGMTAAQMDKMALKATEKVFGKADAQQFDLLRQVNILIIP